MMIAMFKSLACCIVLLCLPTFPATAAEPWPGPGPHPAPPVAQIVPHVVKSAHGQREDEYHWLRDDSPQTKRPEVMRHLQAENAYTAAMMAPCSSCSDSDAWSSSSCGVPTGGSLVSSDDDGGST